MSSLFLYLAVTVAGYFIGARLKKSNIHLPWVGPLQTVVIVLLVFLMGSRIGSNAEIVASLDTIGLISLAYTIIIMAVTVALTFVARRLLGFDRYGVRRLTAKSGNAVGAGDFEHVATSANAGAAESEVPEESEPADKPKRINTLTLLIVAFVAVGIAAGYLVLPEGFLRLTGGLLTLSLCMLLVLIGIDIGTEGTLVQNFRGAGWRILVFPFVSILAMMVASGIAALVLPLGFRDSLCVGSGFAWYSLAPAMLADYSVKVSAISFMHNVFREIISILLIPAVAGRVGYIESYSLPGAPSMDVCLPVIERATSGDVAVYSFINGAILSAAVPVLINVFMNL